MKVFIETDIKRSILIALASLLLLCIPCFSDELATNLSTEVLESFDEEPLTHWIARGSKFTTKEYDSNGNLIGIYPKMAEASTFPTALFGFKRNQDPDAAERKVLGIMGKFDRRGYNYIEIIPAVEADAGTAEGEIIYEDPNTGKKWVHNPLSIPGRVQYFDTWVWGANYDYRIDAHFEDYRGITYSYTMGSLKYAGWKNLRVAIPQHIPQSEPYIPMFKPLKFTKFVLWTQPEERVSGFYIYLDHIKVLTDIYTTRFDGDDLADTGLTQEIWGSPE